MLDYSFCTWTAAGESGPADVGQLELLVGEVDGVGDVVLDVGGFRRRRRGGRRRVRAAARVKGEEGVRHCVGRRRVRGGGRIVGHDVILKLE